MLHVSFLYGSYHSQPSIIESNSNNNDNCKVVKVAEEANNNFDNSNKNHKVVNAITCPKRMHSSLKKLITNQMHQMLNHIHYR